MFQHPVWKQDAETIILDYKKSAVSKEAALFLFFFEFGDSKLQ